MTSYRTELDELKKIGISFEQPHEVIDIFEQKIANFAGAKYGVAVDSATHALELSLRFLKASGAVEVPAHTYPSVPMTLIKLGCKINWSPLKWSDFYYLKPYPVIDASLLFQRNMYVKESLFCLSFQFKKLLPIGRGGMILTDNLEAYTWLKKACHDGRTPGISWKQDNISILGYHYYMTPEDAAHGLLLLNQFQETKTSLGGHENYPDLRKMTFAEQF